MSLPNPMFDPAQTGEIPAYSSLGAWSPAEQLRSGPARLQTMMLPNGRWLLVMDNASEVDRLPSGLDRDDLCERTGAVAVLTFGEPVEITEAYPEQVVERDEALVAELLASLRTYETLQVDLEAAEAKLAAVRAAAQSAALTQLGADILRVLDGPTVPAQRVA